MMQQLKNGNGFVCPVIRLFSIRGSRLIVMLKKTILFATRARSKSLPTRQKEEKSSQKT